MYGILIFLHLVVSVVLILAILIQQPQKGGMASIMGGAETVFGGGGAAPFMAKVTTGLAIAFMLTSLGLVMVSARQTNRPVAPARTAPTQPAAPITP
ncbi:MAG: preprotein translocase subunit SecG [bacterium]